MIQGCRYTKTAYGICIELHGELDHHIAKSLCNQIDDILYSQRLGQVVLDLSGLNFMDSAGLGLILGRYNKITDLGGTMVLQNPNVRTRKLLELAGIAARIPIVFTKEKEKKQERKQTV